MCTFSFQGQTFFWDTWSFCNRRSLWDRMIDLTDLKEERIFEICSWMATLAPINFQVAYVLHWERMLVIFTCVRELRENQNRKMFVIFMATTLSFLFQRTRTKLQSQRFSEKWNFQLFFTCSCKLCAQLLLVHAYTAPVRERADKKNLSESGEIKNKLTLSIYFFFSG